MSENGNGNGNGGALLAEINRNRLFFGSCMSLISTAVVFGVVSSLVTDFKDVFALTNAQAGLIGGVTLWGFTVTIFICGPLCDAIGMGRLMRVSLLGHIVGPLLMIFANGFNMLFIGGLITSMANGIVEGVCNPLIATIYPDQKIKKLNQFHMWFPGGIVIGGLGAFFIAKGLGDATWAWQAKLSLVFIPTVIYGLIFTGQKFPPTERVASGASFGDMVKGTLLRPLFWVLILCMGITATLELGPGRWMADVMAGAVSRAIDGIGDKAGILVLVYGSTLMAVLRYFGGSVAHKLSPTGLLVISAILGALGLVALTYATSVALILASATLFYVGVCFFWPTMLGVTSERVPKGGALALALMGGWGMAVVGLVGAPIMGVIVDKYAEKKLEPKSAYVVIQEGVVSLKEAKAAEKDSKSLEKIDAALAVCQEALEGSTEATLMEETSLKALREINSFAVKDSPAQVKAAEILKSADDYGGKWSFRWVASTALVLVVVFGSIFLKDKSKGGYQAERV